MMRKFLRQDVQSILNQISGYNLEKIFKFRPLDRVRPPKYMFLTDEDYKLSLERSELKGRYMMRMPPVMEPAEEKTQILCKDKLLKGYVDRFGHSNYNLVFTDISSGFTDRSRIIAVREPDGTLRRALLSERKRMNQIYFPLKYRMLETPKMFEQDQLVRVLDKPGNYVFVLERACLQFDPDEHDYIRVTTTVYEHVNSRRAFEDLRSTRHFGPMSFYLANNRKLDRLLQDMLERDLLPDAVSLIRLYSILNEQDFESKYAGESALQTIKKFVQSDDYGGALRHELELIIQKLEEIQDNQAKSAAKSS